MTGSPSTTYRLGVDVGGTFTDLVLHDPRRDLVHTGKLLTTPDDPSAAIVAGIERLLAETGLGPADLHSIVHGTTLVTNTVIERTTIENVLINPETNVVKNGSSDTSVFTIKAEMLEEGFFIRSIKDEGTGEVRPVVEFE